MIVAVVLIVLIVVAGVSVLWVGILPLINIERDVFADDYSIEIISSEGYTMWDEENKILSVQVFFSKSGQVIPDAISFVFVFNGESVSKKAFDVPAVGSKKVYYFQFLERDKPDSVGVSLVFGDNEGSILSQVNINKLGELLEVPENAITVGNFFCGDGVVDDGEDCDEGLGNTDNPDLDCDEKVSYCNEECLLNEAQCNVYCSGGNICNNGYCSGADCIPVSCGMVITEGGVSLNMDTSLECNTGDHERVISIQAEDVRVDCSGNSVYSNYVNDYGWQIGAGFYVTSAADNLVLENCDIYGFANSLDFRASNIYGLIKNNRLHHSGQGSFEIASSSRNTYEGNEFYNCTYSGIMDDEGGYLKIINNVFHDINPMSYGKAISASTRNHYLSDEIINNTFYNNKYGISLGMGGGSIVKGNTFFDNHYSLYLKETSSHPFGNNDIRDNTFEGDVVSLKFYFSSKLGEDYCTLEGCFDDVFDNNTVGGKDFLYLVDESGVEVSGDFSGIVCKNCRDMVFRDVVIDSSGSEGIIFYDSYDIVFEGDNRIENREIAVSLLRSHDISIDVDLDDNDVDFRSLDSYGDYCNGVLCPSEECSEDEDCFDLDHYGATTPLFSYEGVCNLGKCEPECLIDDDCIGNQNGDYCYNWGCVECLNHDDCSGVNDICWWNNTCISFECSEDLDCEDYNDCSEDVCVGGYCEFQSIPVLDDCYYCVNPGFTRGYYADYTMGRNYGGVDFDRDGDFDADDSSFFYDFFWDTCKIEEDPFCNYADGSRNLFVGSEGFTGHELPAPLSSTYYGISCKVEE